MSKRFGSPVARPAKRVVKQEPDCVDLTCSPVEQPPATTTDRKPDMYQPTFLPAATGPKTRVLQMYVLDYQPRVVVTISLNGVHPEIRFTTSDNAFVMTGGEFLYMVELQDEWPANMVLLNDTQLEPHARGCRLTHFQQGPCGFNFFELSEGAVTQLKTKMDAMATHVHRLLASESNISTMFDCIVRVFKSEYLRLETYNPIGDHGEHFEDLCRLVECHVPPYTIVRDFCFNTSGCQLNHYSLLACALAQKKHLRSLLVRLDE